MTAPRFLLLTDHRGHSVQNSLYALARTLAADPRTGTVYVASRGTVGNAAFFSGEVTAPLRALLVDADFHHTADHQRWEQPPHFVDLAGTDAVWLRLPPPADERLFLLLADYVDAGDGYAPTAGRRLRIINDPRGILRTGNKAFLLSFPAFTPPVRRVQTKEQVRTFAAAHPLVLKPLTEYGGRGLVRVEDDGVETEGRRYPLEEWLDQQADIDYLAMKFLRNVTAGDKRILVVNGRILGASLRVPAAGEWLCNVSRGGTSLPATVTPEEEAMVAAIAPQLLDEGILICGFDTLTDDDGRRVLSEINTNSVGGFPQAEAQTGRPVLQQTIDELFAYLAHRT